jgi:hypothetical protein
MIKILVVVALFQHCGVSFDTQTRIVTCPSPQTIAWQGDGWGCIPHEPGRLSLGTITLSPEMWLVPFPEPPGTATVPGRVGIGPPGASPSCAFALQVFHGGKWVCPDAPRLVPPPTDDCSPTPPTDDCSPTHLTANPSRCPGLLTTNSACDDGKWTPAVNCIDGSSYTFDGCHWACR